jgi:hypothetical protein
MNSAKPLDWSGQTCVIAASGPSLTHEQLQVARYTHPLIVTNATFRLAPWADVIFGIDFMFWRSYADELRKAALMHKCWTCDSAAAERWQLKYMRNIARDGLGKRELCTGGNSGYAAINLAYLFGCRRILLIGFDMREGPNGEKHWHPDHPSPCVQKHQFEEWLHKFTKLAADLKAEGCEVINCTPGSALDVFPRSTLESEL